MIDQRLTELRQEYARGQAKLDLLDRQRQEVRDTLLRISGAIQVLEELSVAPESNGAGPAEPVMPVTAEP